MALSSWWRGDELPELRPVAQLQIESTDRLELLAGLTGLEKAEVIRRQREGHRLYVALLAGVAVAYGWVATRRASIGELDLDFWLPATDRYLWDFKTLPAWRGRGIYPHLLQAIVEQESRAGASRFWIINAPENAVSGAGIARAGFRPVGELLFSQRAGVLLEPAGATERVRAGAALLNLTAPDSPQHPPVACCWQCVIAPETNCHCASCHQSGPEAACECVPSHILIPAA